VAGCTGEADGEACCCARADGEAAVVERGLFSGKKDEL
jgi:hypothetical protein